MDDQNALRITVDVYSDVVCPRVTSASDGSSVLSPNSRRLQRRHLAAIPIKPSDAWKGMDRRIYLEAKFGSRDSYHRLEEQVAAPGGGGISFAL